MLKILLCNVSPPFMWMQIFQPYLTEETEKSGDGWTKSSLANRAKQSNLTNNVSIRCGKKCKTAPLNSEKAYMRQTNIPDRCDKDDFK